MIHIYGREIPEWIKNPHYTIKNHKQCGGDIAEFQITLVGDTPLIVNKWGIKDVFYFPPKRCSDCHLMHK